MESEELAVAVAAAAAAEGGERFQISTRSARDDSDGRSGSNFESPSATSNRVSCGGRTAMIDWSPPANTYGCSNARPFGIGITSLSDAVTVGGDIGPGAGCFCFCFCNFFDFASGFGSGLAILSRTESGGADPGGAHPNSAVRSSVITGGGFVSYHGM